MTIFRHASPVWQYVGCSVGVFFALFVLCACYTLCTSISFHQSQSEPAINTTLPNNAHWHHPATQTAAIMHFPSQPPAFVLGVSAETEFAAVQYVMAIAGSSHNLPRFAVSIGNMNFSAPIVEGILRAVDYLHIQYFYKPIVNFTQVAELSQQMELELQCITISKPYFHYFVIDLTSNSTT